MAFSKIGTIFPISSVKILENLEQWNTFKKQASVTVEAKEAATEKEAIVDKEADFQIVTTIDPEKFIYIHATIMAGVKTASNGYYVTDETAKFINENYDGWTCDDLLHDYPSFRSATTFVEHDQNIERAKGRCIDAIARKMPDTVLIDVLFSVEKRHKDLVANIQSGIINAVSMGCSTEKTVCSICGKEATDPKFYCEHIRSNNKGRMFKCADGKMRKAAELCKNNRFFDVSVVANPAFTGALFRKILSSVEVSNHLLANILTSKIEGELKNGEAILKAASKDCDVVNIKISSSGDISICSGEYNCILPQKLSENEVIELRTAFQSKGDNMLSKLFGKEADTVSHPIERLEQPDYRVDYNEFVPIPKSKEIPKKRDEPVEMLLNGDDDIEKEAKVDQFKCVGCNFSDDLWQVKAASIDAGTDETLICPKCGFVHEIVKEATVHQTDKIQLKDLGFSDQDINKMDEKTAELIIGKEITKKEYEKDPNVFLRKGTVIVIHDIPTQFDDGSYWFCKQGKSIIAKGEKLQFIATVADGKIDVFNTKEHENVFLPAMKEAKE
jgi:hypothetical protein